jgi:hypothetical protein
MRKLTATLTQSGLLAVLLQRHRYKVIELAPRSVHHKQRPTVFWSTVTWRFRALTALRLVDNSVKPLAGTVPRRS